MILQNPVTNEEKEQILQILKELKIFKIISLVVDENNYFKCYICKSNYFKVSTKLQLQKIAERPLSYEKYIYFSCTTCLCLYNVPYNSISTIVYVNVKCILI